jgi:anti-sigma regulatory factor (Ser/Thr protein kinase)
VPAARQHVRKALAGWGVGAELTDRVTLSANELVTNAVSHCRISHARVRITLILPDEEGGRGLALVAALADAWGHRQGPYTKTVWARFTLTPAEATGVPDRT